ncbi:MAG: adenosine kinase [Moraxellaceae bacterium]|nr:adenosine kinase [Moraxellaceae bacterium]
MPHRYDLYAIGNALVDLEYLVTDDFLQDNGVEKGLMTLAEPESQAKLITQLEQTLTREKQASGGSAANSIIAAAAFGARCFYNGKVGNDALGQFYRADLDAAGVFSPATAADASAPTGTCVVMLTPDSERTMNTYLGISAELGPNDVDAEAIRASRWLYIEGYLCTSDSARAAVADARSIAREADTSLAMTFSDPAMVQYFKPQLTNMLAEGVDLLFCNEDEALGFSGTSSIEQAIDVLRKISNNGIITIGPRGAMVWDQHSVQHLDGLKVNAIDTLGAGDSFAGAVLYGLSQGWSLVDSAQLGIRTAAQVVSQLGPRLPLDAYRELLGVSTS